MKPIIVFGLVIFIVIALLVVFIPFLLGFGPQSDGGRTGKGIFMSKDGGLTWEERNTIKGSRSTIAGFSIMDFIISPRDWNHLYVGTKNAGIWRSEDVGAMWEKVVDEAGILDPRAEILKVAISKANPKLWYVAVYQKNRGSLLKSEDGGKSFREVYFVPVDRFGVFDVLIEDFSESVYIVTGQGGFLKSGDGGKSWRVMKWFTDGIVNLEVDQKNGYFYVLTSRGRMYKGADRGQNWVELTSGFSSFDRSNRNQSLVVDKRNSALYLASDYGLIRSFDGGVSWLRVPVIIPPEALPVLSVAINPFDSNKFFISAKSQVYKTIDGGINWAIVSMPDVGEVGKIIIDERDPKVMYLISNR